MGIKTNSIHVGNYESGHWDPQLAVVTYVGDHDTYNNESIRQQGNWPSNSGLTRNNPKVAFLPSQRLGWWERRSDIEIDYGQEAIAAALLEKNYLSRYDFGREAGGWKRNYLHDYLDLEPQLDIEGYRDQLADVAGDLVEGPGDQTEQAPDRKVVLEKEFSRGDLMKVTGEFDHDFDNISSAKHLEFVDFLYEQDDEEVNETVEEIHDVDLSELESEV